MPIVNVALKLPGGDREMRFNFDPARANEELILGDFERGQLYQPDIAGVFLRAIQPGDTAPDVGTNIGVFTVLAAALAGPEGRVVGFEPAPDNLAWLALAPPRLIKIDTEGAEHRVLAGAIELLMEFEIPYIVAELHDFGLGQ